VVDAAWVALSLVPRIGGKTLAALLARFDGDTSAILGASTAALEEVPGIGPRTAAEIHQLDVVAIERQMARWAAQGVQVLTPSMPGYPPRLGAIDDHPPTLFALGDLAALAVRLVAVVGTRQPGDVALHMTKAIAQGAVRRGAGIVSGMALGIDTCAHQTALDEGGRTVAVLGSGVLHPYPPANRALYQRILAAGCVISEVHPRVPPNPARLVARNRMISALADRVYIMETEADGGAMHAARFALAQGRPLYAVDLPASGNQSLLAEGAEAIPPEVAQVPLD
jgi:DNA processing protein